MGKSSGPTIGYWYRVAYHHGLTIGPIDAFLEMRGGDKTAWQGELTASGTININAPNLWGGEKDQGGIVGDLDVMFGEPTQAVNAYLVSTFGDQTPAWRGFATVVFKGGRYGAMNPYPQKASYKFRRILQGWDSGACWYPGTAEIAMLLPSTPDVTTGYFLVQAGSIYNNVAGGIEVYGTVLEDYVGTADAIAQNAIAARNSSEGASYTFLESYLTNDGFGNYYIGGASIEEGLGVGIAGVAVQVVCPTGYEESFVEHGMETPLGVSDPTVSCTEATISGYAINPAHVLYDSRTCNDMGREPTANINEASLQAAADKLYAEGFGICPIWDPSAESVEDFEQRICKLIGGSFTRSLEDGQWYLDLARGDYVLESLPILTDDDILDFKEQPSTLDSAINSVSVRYFDPLKKESIVTPPVRALGLVAAFGTIHQTYECPEIPTASLAVRVAQMKLLATGTPTRALELITTRRTYAWRPDQYFRLQSTRRGIADMVCIVGEKQSGTLKSGAIRMKATQDIYSLPATSFVEVEPGVDTRPSQTPTVITLQRAIEAPYIEIAAVLPRADLAALPDDVGFLMAVAAVPASELNYTMMVAAAGGSYIEAGRGEWCATATVVESTILPLDTEFTLADSVQLDQVAIGMAALWDAEIVRVDAIDAGAGTISLGRGCADTVPATTHAAGSRLWFYPVGYAFASTEYADAETIDIKLLSNTGSQQLPLVLATALELTFDQRQFRPYPPGQFTINGSSYPAAASGLISVGGVARDRLLQVDQLVDTTEAGIGPEPGTTYTIRYYADGLLEHTETGITSLPSTYTPAGDCLLRIELESVREGATSWQKHVHELAYTTTEATPWELQGTGVLQAQDGSVIYLMG